MSMHAKIQLTIRRRMRISSISDLLPYFSIPLSFSPSPNSVYAGPYDLFYTTHGGKYCFAPEYAFIQIIPLQLHFPLYSRFIPLLPLPLLYPPDPQTRGWSRGWAVASQDKD